MADKYILRVTAGPGYDLSKHTEVPVNTSAPVKIHSEHIDVEVNIRIQNYRGLPRGSPSTSPYFSTEPHASNEDQYSIAFRFTLRDPAKGAQSQAQSVSSPSPSVPAPDGKDDDDDDEPRGVSGHDLQFGNDLDHPIRDRLPPGFGTALNIVRWWVDPGLEGDAYADRPHLYGPALSSLNVVRVGAGAGDPGEEEGAGDEAGKRERRAAGMPDGAKARMKWGLGREARERWVWRFGRAYAVDFFNPYLDFSEFALRLPGFNLPIMRYWDGQGLRYVLRNRSTGQVYLVVVFSLYRKEDVNEDGSIKSVALEAVSNVSGGVGRQTAPTEGESDAEPFDEEKVLEVARRKLSGVDLEESIKTSADDVD